MQVNIITASKTNGIASFEAECGKKAASIVVSGAYVSVCNKNAAHRAWGGMGRTFQTLQAAKEAYKSGEMKAMIESAALWLGEVA